MKACGNRKMSVPLQSENTEKTRSCMKVALTFNWWLPLAGVLIIACLIAVKTYRHFYCTKRETSFSGILSVMDILIFMLGLQLIIDI